MIDEHFYKKKSSYSIFAISEALKCELLPPPSSAGNPEDIIISDVSSIESANQFELAFLSNPKYEKLFHNTKAGLCIINKNYTGEVPENTWLLKSDNPYHTYALAIDLFYEPLINPQSAAIDPTAKIGKNSQIGHYCVIEAGVEIGYNAQIGAGTFIGHGVKIGNNVRIDSGVSISYSIIGDDVVILPGARIGQDGFGFATKAGKHCKIFHIGRVLIGDDVEIGANTTIDRGSMQDTVIGDGVRIDNLVQIAHNVHIGKGSIIVAQVGIAGSSKIGNYCALGGQVGVSGHITIADQVQVVAQSGLVKDIEERAVVVAGTPAVPVKDWHRQTIFLKKAIGRKA